MPQIVPSTGAYIGEALAPVVDAVGNMLNPNKRFQDSVLAAISKDPSLIQQFADFEAGSPGILKNLGIPALGGVTPTPEAEFAAKMRDQIIQGDAAILEAKTQKSKLDSELIRAAQKIIVDPNSPKEARDAALKQLNLGTTAERTIEEEQAKAAPDVTRLTRTRANVEEAEAPGKINFARLQDEGYAAAAKLLNEGPEITMQRWLNNEFTNRELMGIATTPLLAVLQMKHREYLEKLQRDAQTTGNSDALERLRLAETFDLWNRTGGVAGVKSYYDYMHGGGQEAVSTLVNKDETTLTPPERDLINIHRAIGAAKQIEDSKNTQQLLSRLNTVVGEFKRIQDSAGDNEGLLQLQAQIVNGFLSEIGAPFIAFYGKSGERGITNPFGGNKDLRFRDRRDKSDKVVPLGAITSYLTTRTEAPPENGLTPQQQSRVNEYKALKTEGEKQAFLSAARGALRDDPAALEKFERAIGVRK